MFLALSHSAAQQPIGDPVTQGLGRLTWEYGVLGIICVLLIAALVWLVKRWQVSMQAQVSMTKNFGADLKEQNDAQTNLIVETNRNNDALNTQFGLLKTEVGTQKTDLTNLQTAVNGLQATQATFIEVAKARAG